MTCNDSNIGIYLALGAAASISQHLASFRVLILILTNLTLVHYEPFSSIDTSLSKHHSQKKTIIQTSS